MRQLKQTWNVYYHGRLLDETAAVSAKQAINNVRYKHFISKYVYSDLDDFKAVQTIRTTKGKREITDVSL